MSDEDADAFVAAVATDYTSAPLTAADRAMLDYADKLTRTPQRMTAADIDALRAHGWSDRDVSQIVQITAMFAYYNRIADGLGIADEPEWSSR